MKFTLTRFFAFLLCAQAIDVIEIKGRHFVQKGSDTAFFIKGIDYQPGGEAAVKPGSDPLSNTEQCLRDVYVFQQLGLNTIRVYSIDPELNHDACMSILASAGIYVVLDVNSPLPNQHLNRYEPHTTYHEAYLTHVFKVMEIFSGYDNLLAFMVANEVINNEESAEASPVYIKALIRDMKEYMANHIHRKIPLGYSAADDLRYRIPLSNYLACGDIDKEGDVIVDFYAVNTYQWCGDQTFETSGYDKLVEAYKDYSIPVILSEFGCNKVQPRFTEIKEIYGPRMTGVFSGGLVYQYTNEGIKKEGRFGVVELKNDEITYIDGEYDVLLKAFKNAPKPNVKADTSVSPPGPCNGKYDTLGVGKIPKSQGKSLIEKGLPAKRFTKGNFVQISKWSSNHRIFDANGNEVTSKKISKLQNADPITIPSGGYNPSSNTGSSTKSKKKSAASRQVIALAAALVSIIGCVLVL